MKYCSLGDSCKASYGLQSIGLKTESYPFDWINSRSEIIKMCIQNEFKDFLDRSLYYPQVNEHDAERICDHSIYTPILNVNPLTYKQVFFRHRDPLSLDKDYEYYTRCVDRFKNLLASDEDKLFIKTYVNQELDKSFLDDSLSLVEFLESHTTNYKMVAIKHSVTGTQSFKVEEHKNLIYIEITTIDHTDGGTFYNYTDSTFFKSLLSYFINKAHDIR